MILKDLSFFLIPSHEFSSLKTDFPFSGSFGLCDKRESCVERAQETYFRLMLRDTEAKFLNFETIAVLGLASGGNRDVNRETIKGGFFLQQWGLDSNTSTQTHSFQI